MVEFRLLGDVAVAVDGRAWDVGPPRYRCLLAALLVDADRGLPAETIIDRLWGHRPPQSARDVLYSYLCRLRRRLRGLEGVELTRKATGYLLSVDRESVDLYRFRALVDRARITGDEADGLRHLEEALGLWRGDAFGALDTPWLNVQRGLLAEERHTAQLDRDDILLRRGGHAALVADLTARVRDRPLDERVTGQLMLALYRCGRQADALACHERLRHRLADTLGVGPGPEVRRLHLAILRSAVQPAPPAGVTVGAAGTRPNPHQLPPSIPDFTGRAADLAELDRLLAITAGHTDPTGDGPPPVVISALAGTAGVGKTALAVHWAHRVRDRFPDGQLYVNLRGFGPGGQPMAPGEAIRGFLDALDVPARRVPTGLDAQAALYRSLLAGRRMLVVADNACDAEQVRPLLPGTPGCLIVVTSRDHLSGLVAVDGAHPLILDLLAPEEARRLLAVRVGADRVAADPQAVEDIVAACARLPLALAIVAGGAATRPRLGLAAIAADLRRAGGALGGLAGGGDPYSDVRAVFSWSYRALGPPAARLFRLLGLVPGPDISLRAAASLAGLPADRTRLLLADLARVTLVTEPSPGRYALHDLLRAYAGEQARIHDPDDERRAAVHRLLDHYLHTAHTADRVLIPSRDRISLAVPRAGVTPEDLAGVGPATDWFDRERVVLLAAVRSAAAGGFDTHAWQLAWTLSIYLDRRGRWHDWAGVQRAAVAAAGRLADRDALAGAHRSLALANTRLGRFDDAHQHFQRALDLLRELGDRTGQAHTHLNFAEAFELRGRHREALEHSRQALGLYRSGGHGTWLAAALNNVGWYHAQLGDYEQALICCQQALDLLQEVGDRDAAAHTWSSLGYAHQHLGHHSLAVACYQESRDLLRDLGDRYNEARVLLDLGDIHHPAGDLDQARDAWQHALTILRGLDHHDVGEVHTRLDRLDRAVSS